MCFLCEAKVCTVIHMCNGYSSCSLWIFQMAEELRSLLTTGAAAHAASTLRPPLSRSAAAAAAATRPVSPPSVPQNPRTVALAQRKIYSTIVIKVRMTPPTSVEGLLQDLAHTFFALDHCIIFFLLLSGGLVKD